MGRDVEPSQRSWVSSFLSCRRRWPVRRGARSRSPSAERVVSGRCLARCSTPMGCGLKLRRFARKPTGRSISTSSVMRRLRPMTVVRPRGGHGLTPYYEEFGLDPAAVSAGPGRLPFDSETAGSCRGAASARCELPLGVTTAGLLARVKACGAKVLSSATTVDEARWLEAQRASDVIIAQGYRGGRSPRHVPDREISTRRSGTFALVPSGRRRRSTCR